MHSRNPNWILAWGQYAEHTVDTEKEVKRSYSAALQSTKGSSVISNIKTIGKHIPSRIMSTQTRELSFGCIDYNTLL
jgi:hypothetical protein